MDLHISPSASSAASARGMTEAGGAPEAAALSASARDHLSALSGMASELSLAVHASTPGAVAAAWGQLCLEDMRVSRLQVHMGGLRVRGWNMEVHPGMVLGNGQRERKLEICCRLQMALSHRHADLRRQLQRAEAGQGQVAAAIKVRCK